MKSDRAPWFPEKEKEFVGKVLDHLLDTRMSVMNLYKRITKIENAIFKEYGYGNGESWRSEARKARLKKEEDQS